MNTTDVDIEAVAAITKILKDFHPIAQSRVLNSVGSLLGLGSSQPQALVAHPKKLPKGSKKDGNVNPNSPLASSQSKENPHNKEDHLAAVRNALEPLIDDLPQVSRQEGAKIPGMETSAVRKRLSAKRAELARADKILSENPNDPSALYGMLNAIQAFRIAGRDAEQRNVVLSTFPFTTESGFITHIEALRGLSAKLIQDKNVLPNGFFTNQDHVFSKEEKDVGKVEEKSTSF